MSGPNGKELMSNSETSSNGLALVFPGQASQYVGMGQELYRAHASVRELYQFTSDELGEDISAISFAGPADKLKKTRYTQPAILTHSLAALSLAQDKLQPLSLTAGHSLGEYGALVAAGSLTAFDAIRLVARRAELMEEASNAEAGAMAAIIGLNPEQVEQLCASASAAGVVTPANFNSRSQIVISGSQAGVKKAMELAKEQGAKRAIALEVGGAFHSPLMESAQAGMKEALARVTISPPQTLFVPNALGTPVSDPEEIRQLLVSQITSPVRWAQTMEKMKEVGIKTLIEVGPGKTLIGLARRELTLEKTVTLDSLSDIEYYLEPTLTAP